jgi:hypothetical protein
MGRQVREDPPHLTPYGEALIHVKGLALCPKEDQQVQGEEDDDDDFQP